jgi:transposase
MSTIKKAELRPAFVHLSKERGKTFKDIAEFFGVSRQTVSNAVNRFNETGSNNNRAGSGRKRTARIEENIQQIADLLKLNNHTKLRNGTTGSSSRKLAARLGKSQQSILRILHDDLGLEAWKKQKRQKLTKDQKQKRLVRATALKERFSNGRHRQKKKEFPTLCCTFVVLHIRSVAYS